MLKLKNLLLETGPAEKARSMGLEPMSFGRYGKDGIVTHRIVGDKLVAVNHDEVDGNDNPSAGTPKPSSMDAKTAGKKQNNQPTPDDVAKTQTKNQAAPDKGYPDLHAPDEKEKESKGEKGAEDQGPPVAAPNVFAPKRPAIGRPVDRSELRKLVNPEDWHTKDYVLSADTIMCQPDEFWDFIYNRDQNEDDETEQEWMGMEVAKAQNQWRDQLDPIVQEELIHVQTEWQTWNQFNDAPERRIARNTFINSVAAGPPPATLTNVQRPIERGMSIHEANVEQFLSAFRVGDDVDLPPSGFSSKSSVARQFLDESFGMPVLIRLAPNRKGELHGIALTGVKPANPEIGQGTDLRGYASEQEIIRPSGPKARCINITRMMTPDSKTGKNHVCYVIDLEEQGYPEEAMLGENHDEDWVKTPNDIFLSLMNTPVNHRKPKKTMAIRELAFRVLLKKFLNEGKAADQAHKLGLHHHGGPYWSKNGVVVAKTVKDRLVKVTPEEAANVATFADKLPKDDTAKNMPYDNEWDTHGSTESYSSLKGDADVVIGDLKPLKTNAQTGGTNLGGIFQGSDGKKRYVKFYADGNKSQCEALANALYKDLGIAAPDSQYIYMDDTNAHYAAQGLGASMTNLADKFAFASDMIEGDAPTLAEVKAKNGGIIPKPIAAKILQGFAADCLIANWDTLGIDNTNVRVLSDGTPIRVDNGSAFLHRATNGRKPESALDNMTEFDGFASPKNQTYSALFAALGIKSAKQMPDSFKKQVATILNLVHEAGGWEKYVNERVPDMDEPDKQKVIRMLYERTKQLIDKVKENP